MKATIWHNPRCSKSRQALTLLAEAGATVEVVEYLSSPPTVATLRDLFARAGLTPREGLRADARVAGDDAAVLAAMAAEPALIERPLVATERGVVLARPPERVCEIL